MAAFLSFLCEQGYVAQIDGLTWWSGIYPMTGMEHTGRHFQVSLQVVFTPEMVEKVTVLPGNKCIVRLVH